MPSAIVAKRDATNRFSGPALEHFYQQKTGELLSLSEIDQRAETGEVAAQATLKRLQEKFAEAIAVPINILDPHAIVIGGGVDNIGLYIKKRLVKKFFPTFLTTN